jgi:exoribonuclease-2
VVRTPKYWGRIVAVAAEQGTRLPNDPDSAALERFLIAARAANPATFPDLSLTVIKLLGAGEYVLERPGGVVPGHFGLAIKDYAHATAPNRRYPDLLTHRLVKAALIDQPAPYSDEELTALALHCTEQEDAAKKVERQVTKCAAALLLQTQIGRIFDGIITGASVKGTFVRITHPPSEGLVVAGGAALEVGDRVRVKLRAVDLNRCYIDFEAVR